MSGFGGESGGMGAGADGLLTDHSMGAVNDRYNRYDQAVEYRQAALDFSEEWDANESVPMPILHIDRYSPEEIKEEVSSDEELVCLKPKKKNLIDFDLSVEQCLNSK